KALEAGGSADVEYRLLEMKAQMGILPPGEAAPPAALPQSGGDARRLGAGQSMGQDLSVHDAELVDDDAGAQTAAERTAYAPPPPAPAADATRAQPPAPDGDLAAQIDALNRA
ncbi:MAG TPA: hypothetical protein VF665_25565, partial [Longimicrobium sp.]